MNTRRVWVFRSLVVFALLIMSISFFGGPWWHAIIEPSGPEEGVWIYPYAFQYNLEGMSKQYIRDVEVPGFLDWVPWVYVTFVVGTVIYSLWKPNSKISRILLMLVGFSFIVYAAFFIFYARMRMEEYNIPLSGKALVIGDPVNVYVTGIINWIYYLSYIASILFIGIALLRNRIIGLEKIKV